MTSRQKLRDLYGFDWPDELFALHDFFQTHRDALDGALPGLWVFGPVDVLRGDFDGLRLDLPMTLHWRYRFDPPEYFTVLGGNVDGHSFGYVLDDPSTGAFRVGEYYRNDGPQFSSHRTMFEALRLELETAAMHTEAEETETLEAQAVLREILKRHGTGDRPETGNDYFERHRFEPEVTAPTFDQLGIVVPEAKFSAAEHEVDADDDAQVKAALVEARDLLGSKPGRALQLGRDLWTRWRHRDVAAALLRDAYAALDRPVLKGIVEAHHANVLESVALQDRAKSLTKLASVAHLQRPENRANALRALDATWRAAGSPAAMPERETVLTGKGRYTNHFTSGGQHDGQAEQVVLHDAPSPEHPALRLVTLRFEQGWRDATKGWLPWGTIERRCIGVRLGDGALQMAAIDLQNQGTTVASLTGERFELAFIDRENDFSLKLQR